MACSGCSFCRSDRKNGILVEINCETDFVAKNEDFVHFSNEVAQILLADPQANLETKRAEQVGKIGENIKISRSQAVSIETNGIVESYVHTGAKVAVMVSLVSSDGQDLGSNNQLISLAKDICMHIAATSPVCVSRDDIPEDLVSKEKDIALAQAEGKPPQAVEKIVAGKLEKYFSTSCLLEQPFVKDPDSSVLNLLSNISSELGSDIKVGTFLRFQVGEEN